MNTFRKMIAAGRSKGICALIGSADITAVEELYSKKDATAILKECGTVLNIELLPSTSQYECKHLLVERKVSEGMQPARSEVPLTAAPGSHNH
jgi:hypothetical protein